MLKLVSGRPLVEWYPKTASTLLYANSVVALSSGKLIAATATTLAHVGVFLRPTITTGDSDYASTTSCPVMVPSVNDIFEADVKSGVTFAATSVGVECDFFIGDGTTGTLGETYVDTGTNSHHQVTIVGFISSSKALVKITSLITLNNPAAA